jgi:DNA-binding MarR family transcriptional regulator
VSDDLRDQAQLVTRAMPRVMRHLFALDEDDPAGMLSVAQLRVCAVLAEGPVPMSTISRDLGMSLSAMTQIADRLQRAGYVRRVRDEDDRRVRVLQLTPRAEKAMRERRERHVERVMELLAHLPGGARDDLVRALSLLEAALPRPEPGEDADVESFR